MIENIRKYTGLMIVVLVLLFIGLVFLENSVSNAFTGKSSMVIDGQKISLNEFRRKGMNPLQIPRELPYSPLSSSAKKLAVKYAGNRVNFANSGADLLNMLTLTIGNNPERFLANRIAVREAGLEYGVTPGPDEVTQFIRKVIFSDPDGEFDKKTYDSFLSTQLGRLGIDSRSFNEYIRDLLTAQNLSNVIGSSLAPDPEAIKMTHLINKQSITGQELQLTSSKLENDQEPTEEEIRAYWEENEDKYNSDEKRGVSYIMLTPDWDQKLIEVEAKKAEEEKKRKEAEEARKAKEAEEKKKAEEVARKLEEEAKKKELDEAKANETDTVETPETPVPAETPAPAEPDEDEDEGAQGAPGEEGDPAPPVVEKVIKEVAEKVEDAKEGVADAAQNAQEATEKAKEIVKGTTEELTEKPKDLVDAAKEKATATKDAVKDLTTAAKDKVAETVDSAEKAAMDSKNAIQGAVKKAENVIEKAVTPAGETESPTSGAITIPVVPAPETAKPATPPVEKEKTAKEKLNAVQRTEALKAYSTEANRIWQDIALAAAEEKKDPINALTENGYSVIHVAPFAKMDPPKALDAFVADQGIGKLSDVVFKLPPSGAIDEKLSNPYRTNDGYFIGFLGEVIPSKSLTYEEAKVKVTVDLKKKMAREALIKQAEEAHEKLVAAVKEGKTFADAAKELELTVKPSAEIIKPVIPIQYRMRGVNFPTPPAFIAAKGTEPGQISKIHFSPSEEEPETATIVFVEKREFKDDAAFSNGLSREIETATDSYRLMTFEAWLQNEYGKRNIQVLSQQQ